MGEPQAGGTQHRAAATSPRHEPQPAARASAASSATPASSGVNGASAEAPPPPMSHAPRLMSDLLKQPHGAAPRGEGESPTCAAAGVGEAAPARAAWPALNGVPAAGHKGARWGADKGRSWAGTAATARE